MLVAGEYEPERQPPHVTGNRRMSQAAAFADPRLAALDGFRVEIDAARERADIILDRPPLNVVSMPQRDQLRLVFEALDEDARVRVIVLRAVGEHFSSGGNIKGFMEASPETVVQARLEHRGAGALREAGDRRQSRLLLRRRLRAVARLRLPHRLGDLLLRAARAAARADSGLRRLGAAAEDRRHHPHQGHRDALAPHRRPSRPTTGASPPNACPTASSNSATDALVDELRAFSPLAQRTAKKLLNDTEDAMLTTAIELEGHCYSRLRQSDDFREGVEAFHAKRPAQFKGT